jgi:hypothetical protein
MINEKCTGKDAERNACNLIESNVPNLPKRTEENREKSESS